MHEFASIGAPQPVTTVSELPRLATAREDETPKFGGVMSVSKGRFHRVAYTEWGDRDDDLVVCVHGLTRQCRDFDYLARDLATAGRRVICPDLPGRGLSDWLEDPHDYDVAQYVVDMSVLIASLRSGPLDWIGTSLGGLVGMLIAGRDNSPIKRLVMNDIGPDIHVPAVFRIWNYIRSAPTSFPSLEAADRYFRTILAPFGRLTDEQWLHLARHSLRAGPGVNHVLHYDPRLPESFRTSYDYNKMFWAAWDNIKCPILVLRGETSDLLTVRATVEMAARNPRATILEVAGCGHAPALADPDQIALVTSWLAETPAFTPH